MKQQFSKQLTSLLALASGLIPALALTADETPTILFVTGDSVARFSIPVLFDEGVAMLTSPSSASGNTAIQQFANDSFKTIADFTTPYPADPANFFTAFYNLASDGDALYFVGNSNRALNGHYGLFRYTDETFSVLVADAAELGPNDGFAGISGVKAAAGKVVFHTRQNPYEAYYLHDGDSLVKIAESGMSVAENEGEIMELPTTGASISQNGEHIVIRVKTGSIHSDYTVYRFIDGELIKVLNVGDSVGDITVSNMMQQPVVFNDGSILLNVHTIPAGIAVVHIDADNNASILTTAPTEDGYDTNFNMVNESNDGVYVYGNIALREGVSYIGGKVARLNPNGDYELLFESPFEANGSTWGDSSFGIYDADERGYIGIAMQSDGSSALVSNIAELGGGVGPAPVISLWAEYPLQNGWKEAHSIGWIDDSAYPYVYSLRLNGWTYIEPSGAQLNGFYLYSYDTAVWYYVIEDFNGWAYRFAGGNEDPGWVDLRP